MSNILDAPYCHDVAFMAEWQKMLGGEMYAAQHPYFHELLQQTRSKVRAFNDLDPNDLPELDRCIRSILGRTGEKLHVNQPFHCDYGCNILVGDHVFVNFNLTVLDEALVTIGDHVFIGPNVGIYTVNHALLPDQRNAGIMRSLPIAIGNNVWIGGHTVVMQGVTIGDNTVIGAGSVVTRDIPAGVVAVGSPCRVLRKITEADRVTPV